MYSFRRESRGNSVPSEVRTAFSLLLQIPVMGNLMFTIIFNHFFTYHNFPEMMHFKEQNCSS